MSRQKDVLNLFEFLIDLIKEKESTNVEVIKKEQISEDISSTQLDAGYDRILSLMKKLDETDKARANVTLAISEEERVKKSLQRQLNDLRNEHSLKVSEDTIAEENELNKFVKKPIQSIAEMEKRHAELAEKHENITNEVNATLGINLRSEVKFD